jgi:hypothetical protein
MLKRVSLLLLVLFISNLTAQNPKPDWDDWDDDWIDFRFDYSFGKSPYLELNYGLGELKLKDYNEKFAKTSLLELRLGYRSVDDYYEDYIIKVRDNYSFVQFSSPELRTKDLKNSELNVEHWQFGFGFLKGYGYKIGNFSIKILVITHFFIWEISIVQLIQNQLIFTKIVSGLVQQTQLV